MDGLRPLGIVVYDCLDVRESEVRVCRHPRRQQFDDRCPVRGAQHKREAISARTKAALAVARALGKKLANVNGAAALRRAGKGNVAAAGAIGAPIATLSTFCQSSRISARPGLARSKGNSEPARQGYPDGPQGAVARDHCEKPPGASEPRLASRGGSRAFGRKTVSYLP